MAFNTQFDWRRFDRRLFAAVAVLFPVIVLLGFGRTYYARFAFDVPPVPSKLVHLHGLVMSAWVLLFCAQVFLIRTKNHRVHMRLGFVGLALAVAIVFIGFFTAVAGAKFVSPSTPPGVEPLRFLAVPLFDMVTFSILFGAAFIYRTRPAEHKRLILLTIIGLLPPAIARFPFEPFISGGPPVFFGVPSLIILSLLVFDTWKNRKLNQAFLAGAILLILSYPLRLAISGTDTWMTFATWLTTWAA